MTDVVFGSITISLVGDVFVMRMHGGAKNQSVFNPEFGKMFHDALDYVEKFSRLHLLRVDFTLSVHYRQKREKRCLVLTGTGKVH